MSSQLMGWEQKNATRIQMIAECDRLLRKLNRSRDPKIQRRHETVARFREAVIDGDLMRAQSLQATMQRIVQWHGETHRPNQG